MNLFETAGQLKEVVQSKKRAGSKASLASTITIPYFKGIYRKGEKYEVPLTVTLEPAVKANKKKKIEALPAYQVTLKQEVKPLTGAFLVTYFTCLAYDICKDAGQPLTTFVVQALLGLEGFSLDDYAQGKTTGSVRIASHLKAISEHRGLPVTVTEDGVIEGLTDEIVDAVLTAI